MKLLVGLALAGAVFATSPYLDFIGDNSPMWVGQCPNGQVGVRGADNQNVVCATTPTPIPLIPILSSNLGPAASSIRQQANPAPGVYVGNLSIAAGSSALINLVVSGDLAGYLQQQFLLQEPQETFFIGQTTGFCVTANTPSPATLGTDGVVRRSTVKIGQRQVAVLGLANCLGNAALTSGGVTVGAPVAVQSTPANCSNVLASTFSYAWCQSEFDGLSGQNTGLFSSGLTAAQTSYGGNGVNLVQQCQGVTTCLGDVNGTSLFPWRGYQPYPTSGNYGPTPNTGAFNISCASSFVGQSSTVIFNIGNYFTFLNQSNTSISVSSVALALRVTCSYPAITLCCATTCCAGVCTELRSEGVLALTDVCVESCVGCNSSNAAANAGSVTIQTNVSTTNCATLLVVAGVTTCTQFGVTNTSLVSYGLGPCGGFCDAPSPTASTCPVPTASEVWTSTCFCRVCSPFAPIEIVRGQRQAAVSVQNGLEVFGCTTLTCCNQAFSQAACRGLRLTTCVCNVAGVLTNVTCPSCSGSKKGLLGLLGLLGLIPLCLLLSLSCLCLLLLCRRKRTDAPVSFATFEAAQPVAHLHSVPVVDHLHTVPVLDHHHHIDHSVHVSSPVLGAGGFGGPGFGGPGAFGGPVY